MSRRRKMLAKAWGLIMAMVMVSILTTSSVRAYDLVPDVNSGCAMGGKITHDLTGDVLLIRSGLPLLEVSVSRLTKSFDSSPGMLYKIRVFEYLPSEDYGPYFGRGFTLYLFAQEGGSWELDGSGVFHVYEPAGYGDIMYMKGRLPLTGDVEGLATNGSGGRVTGHLKPANPREVLAAHFTVDLEIRCNNSELVVV